MKTRGLQVTKGNILTLNFFQILFRLFHCKKVGELESTHETRF